MLRNFLRSHYSSTNCSLLRKTAVSAVLFLLSASGANAQFEWIIQGGGESPRSFSQGWDIASDSSGNLIAIGDTYSDSDSIRFETARGAGDAFIVKYAANGSLLWLKTIDAASSTAGIGVTSGDAVAIDSRDNLAAVGSFRGQVSFGPASVVSSSSGGLTNTFVAKYRPDGRLVWAKALGGSNAPGGVAVDRRDNVVVVGSFSQTIDIEGTRFTVPDPADVPNAFIAKFDALGNLLWAHHIVRLSTEVQPFGLIQALDVAVDGNDNVLVTGRLSGLADFGGVSAASQINNDSMFVAKYAPDGTFLWVRTARAPIPPPVNRPGSKGNAVTADADNNIYVAGQHRLATEFGGSVIGSELDPHDRMFVAKYRSDGSFVWVREPAEGVPISVICDLSQGYGLTTDSSNNVVVSGVAFGCHSGPRSSGVGYEMLVAKYFPGGGLQWIRNTGRVGVAATTGGGPYGYAVVADPDDAIALTGFFSSFFETGAISLLSRGRSDAFVAKMGTQADRCDITGITACLGEPLWVHQHARCPYRRIDGECEGIFEVGLAPFESRETWVLRISDLSLHSAADSDTFSFTIPDPQDAVYGAVHADIRPEDERIAAPTDRVPLPECGQVNRLGIGLGGRTYTERVFINGAVVVQAIPTANGVSVNAVGTDGESIHLYRDETRADHIGSGSALMKRIDCPRSDPSEVADGKGLTELEFSFGERSSDRVSTATGGYDLRVSYDIEITRRGPAWIFDRARDIRFIHCFGPTSSFGPGGPVPLPPLGFSPFCATLPSFLPDLELPHPRNIFDPDCIADGPGCWEFHIFAWPDTNVAFDMQYASAAKLDIELYDMDGALLATAKRYQASEQPRVTGGIPMRLYVPRLEAGQYVLSIRGTNTTYNISFTPDMQSLAADKLDRPKKQGE